MPYQPLTLGLKFKIAVADLTAADVMVVCCGGCGWRCRVGAHTLISRYRLSVRLVEVERDLRCRRCGKRGSCS